MNIAELKAVAKRLATNGEEGYPCIDPSYDESRQRDEDMVAVGRWAMEKLGDYDAQPDTYAGWTVVSGTGDGRGWLLDSRGGQRRRVWCEGLADDDTPIDDAWLLAVGFEWYEPDGCWILDDSPTIGAWLCDDDPNRHEWHVAGHLIPNNRTRGQLRRLCSALGVELKEQA